MGYKLTQDDKKKVREYAKAHADPKLGDVYRVVVADELNEKGIANYTIIYRQIKEMPAGWKPSR